MTLILYEYKARDFLNLTQVINHQLLQDRMTDREIKGIVNRNRIERLFLDEFKLDYNLVEASGNINTSFRRDIQLDTKVSGHTTKLRKLYLFIIYVTCLMVTFHNLIKPFNIAGKNPCLACVVESHTFYDYLRLLTF